MKSNLATDILLGIVVGDALGVPVEFKSREELSRKKVTTMLGYGTYNQPPGTWSDDSSLALSLAESLLKGYDLEDMARMFIKWRHDANWTPHGDVFDIGRQTSYAIAKLTNIIIGKDFEKLKTLRNEHDEQTNGNGSLMRILPLLLYCYKMPVEQQFELIWDCSALTHGHIRSAMACAIYIKLAQYLAKGDSKSESYLKTRIEMNGFFQRNPIFKNELHHFSRVLNQDISTLPEFKINSGGYVIDSLEAAFWCFMKYSTYSETVLAAVNLGRDTDTTAAIAGGLAGIFYGHNNIPFLWLDKIALLQDIRNLANKLNAKYCV